MKVIISLFILSTVLRLIYWLFFFRNVGKIKPSNRQKTQSIGVSVIVCAKDAYVSLNRLIPLLLDQNYGTYEIIIVDDFSKDETKSLKDKYGHDIKWVEPQKDIPGKKHALTCGIHACSYSIVCLTDADCMPGSKWINSMVKHMEGSDVVLGFSPIVKTKGLLNMFSRFENLMIAIQYFGYATRGLTYMGVGRNLMYKKNIFNRSNGFESHKSLLSGDDDLFVQGLPESAKVNLNLEKESFVHTNGPQGIKDYLTQKVRHTSTSIYYKQVHKLLLGFWAFNHICWVGLLITGLIYININTVIVALSFWLVATYFHYLSFIRLEHKDLIMKFPLLDILLGLNYLIVGILLVYRSWNKSIKWS